jgi:arylsulfatase A-like enzyme
VPCALSAAEKSPPNVLFIAIDDLNHWVGHLGRHPQTKTPNIDRLAESGVSFTKAYCTAPACNPSRASLMSGQRPTTTGCYLNGQNWRPGISEDRLLNSHFFEAGYRVYGAGKIYHGASDRGGEWTDYFDGKGGSLTLDPSAKDDGVGGIKFGPLANTDEEMPDYGVVSYCIDRLGEESDKPFFLACGLVKPHMPFSVPKKWFDLFPLESIELPPHREDDIDGHDITPLLRDPAADWDQPAITTHGRGNHSVRVGDWRYIRYADGSEELYDQSIDPLEYTNLAGEAAQAEKKADLATYLPKSEAADLPGAGGKQKGKGKKNKDK